MKLPLSSLAAEARRETVQTTLPMREKKHTSSQEEGGTLQDIYYFDFITRTYTLLAEQLRDQLVITNRSPSRSPFLWPGNFFSPLEP